MIVIALLFFLFFFLSFIYINLNWNDCVILIARSVGRHNPAQQLWADRETLKKRWLLFQDLPPPRPIHMGYSGKPIIIIYLYCTLPPCRQTYWNQKQNKRNQTEQIKSFKTCAKRSWKKDPSPLECWVLAVNTFGNCQRLASLHSWFISTYAQNN